MSSSLKTADRMIVRTVLGEREIQICLGDITALPQSEKVDFIMVSAFLGDYSPMHGTVIGALHHNLNLKVRELAMDKLQDLRSEFNCWISRKLRSDLPYRQLICFERRNAELNEAVKEVFRAMMPAFNNVNKSVITPLLATGHQQADTVEMLNTMIWTAAEWMWLGMPLHQMKIVIYSRSPNNPDPEAETCLHHFRMAKKKIEKMRRIPKEPAVKQGLYLICCESDSKSVQLLVKAVGMKHKKITFLTKHDVHFRDESWQLDLSEVLLTVARVVPLISSNFLQDAFCIDQFNVALCCNRLTKRHLLAPILIERISLPCYINMVQWVDCRLRTEEQFVQAAITVAEQVPHRHMSSVRKYDIFISYCHKNSDVAEMLLHKLEETHPQPNIFFDHHELKTGVAWQQTIYNAIDNSLCVLALVSPQYWASSMCQEELRLALAKHFSQDKDLELVVIYITDAENEYLNRFLSPVKLGRDRTVADICQSIQDWLSTGKSADIFSPITEPLVLNDDLAKMRELTFKKSYDVDDKGDMIITKPPRDVSPAERKTASLCDVYISYSLCEQKYATFLTNYLRAKRPDLKICWKASVKGNENAYIEAASCIIVLLSPDYVQSVKEVEEFNVLLSRERMWKTGRLLYVVKVTEMVLAPVYFSLVPCDTSLTDNFWIQFQLEHSWLWEKHSAILSSIQISLGHGLNEAELCPMLKAACDVLMVLECGRYLDTVTHSDIILYSILDTHVQVTDVEGCSYAELKCSLSIPDPKQDRSSFVDQRQVSEILDRTASSEFPNKVKPDDVPNEICSKSSSKGLSYARRSSFCSLQ